MNLVTFHGIDQAKPGDKAKGLNIEKYQSSVTHKWFRNMQAFAKVWDPFLSLISLKQMTAWKLSYTLQESFEQLLERVRTKLMEME